MSPRPRRICTTMSFMLYCLNDQICFHLNMIANCLIYHFLHKLFTWDRQASVAYMDFVSSVKKMYDKGNQMLYVCVYIIEAWKAYWVTPEFKTKSVQVSRNRRSEPAGLGIGMVIHHEGSRSAHLHALDLRLRKWGFLMIRPRIRFVRSFM